MPPPRRPAAPALLRRAGAIGPAGAAAAVRRVAAVRKGAGAALQLFVAHPGGTSHAVELPPDATVAMLAAAAGTGHAVLVYDGAELNDPSALLSDVGICAEATVHLRPTVPLSVPLLLPQQSVTERGGGRGIELVAGYGEPSYLFAFRPALRPGSLSSLRINVHTVGTWDSHYYGVCVDSPEEWKAGFGLSPGYVGIERRGTWVMSGAGGVYDQGQSRDGNAGEPSPNQIEMIADRRADTLTFRSSAATGPRSDVVCQLPADGELYWLVRFYGEGRAVVEPA